MGKKYLSKFTDQESALSYTGGGTLISPQVSLIEGVTELVYSKEIPHGSKIKFEKDETTSKLYFVIDGPSYEMVDLGLPSGIKWAACNVGATSPEENGLYFSWGNTDGHAADNGKVIDGYSFDLTTYKSTPGRAFTGLTLDAEHDAATVNMGDGWRMPTSAETAELVDNTTQTVETLNGVRGMRFTSKTNDNSIFIPLAGNCSNGSLYNERWNGCVWSSSIREVGSLGAIFLRFTSDGYVNGVFNDSIRDGRSVRAVFG